MTAVWIGTLVLNMDHPPDLGSITPSLDRLSPVDQIFSAGPLLLGKASFLMNHSWAILLDPSVFFSCSPNQAP